MCGLFFNGVDSLEAAGEVDGEKKDAIEVFIKKKIDQARAD
jgi:hypothetical protein